MGDDSQHGDDRGLQDCHRQRHETQCDDQQSGPIVRGDGARVPDLQFFSHR